MRGNLVDVKQHWKKVRALRCMISGSPEVTIHHCHGGSMRDLPGFINPGAGERSSDWLVIPLHARYHVGEFGIDNGAGKLRGVLEWENLFGTQVEMLEHVCSELGVNVFEWAGLVYVPRPVPTWGFAV